MRSAVDVTELIEGLNLAVLTLDAVLKENPDLGSRTSVTLLRKVIAAILKRAQDAMPE